MFIIFNNRRKFKNGKILQLHIASILLFLFHLLIKYQYRDECQEDEFQAVRWYFGTKKNQFLSFNL